MNRKKDFNNKYLRRLMSTGGDRYDTSKLYEDKNVREYTINSLTPNNSNIDAVTGLETYGLTLGVLIANKINKKFIPIRESGKIPASDEHLKSLKCDYSHRRKTLELDIRRFKSIDRVLLVDDWIESGKQIKTAVNLLDSIDVQVKEISVAGIDDNFDENKIECDINLNTVI